MHAPYNRTNGEALARVEAHTRSEFTNDIDLVMATVSGDVCYVLPDLTKDTVQLVAVSDRAQVRASYTAERELLDIVRSDHLVEVSSEYFVFYESLATTRAKSSGEEVVVNSVVLFPVVSDGIVGELLWSNGSLGGGLRASSEAGGRSLVAAARARDGVQTRAANQRAHEEFVAGWRDGDAKRMVGNLDDACQWMVRDHRQDATEVTGLRSRAAVEHRYAELFRELPVRDLRVLQRVVHDWYVYAEYAVTVEAPRNVEHRVRVGAIHPVAAPGRFAGFLGFEVLEDA
jgi:hypothetical protein